MKPLAGLKFVFTGRLSRPRHEIEREAKTLGGWVDSTVKCDTHYLVVGDRPGRTKLDRARGLQAKQITETAYRGLIADGESVWNRHAAGNDAKREQPPVAIDSAWLQSLLKRPTNINF